LPALDIPAEANYHGRGIRQREGGSAWQLLLIELMIERMTEVDQYK
jgi:hypothetical protein